MDREKILERLDEAGLDVRPREAEKLADYLLLLERWNRIHNLTGIKTAAEMVGRHLIESLVLRRFLRGKRIADVGSGAGLPGIPLAVVEADRTFTLIESRSKRASFLNHAQGALALTNVVVEHDRVEDLRGTAPFDTVLARAVAPLPELVELTAHLLGEKSVLLVPTKVGVDVGASRVDDRFEIRRIEPDEHELLRGTLLAIERRAS